MAQPSAPSTVSDFCQAITRSKQLDAEQVNKLLERWQKEAAPEKLDKVDSFRRWTIRQRILTEYQAALLQRGHTEGFFLGDYKVEDRLGKGRMAGVYRGVDPAGKRVAIKVLPASRAREGNLLNRFQQNWREVVALATVAGIPVPAFSASLGYYDSYRSAVLPANLLQA